MQSVTHFSASKSKPTDAKKERERGEGEVLKSLWYMGKSKV
jgi:hypothetical protein